MELITAPRILLVDRLEGPGWIRIEGERIVACGRGRPDAAPDVELPRGTLAPGLVDIQVNGAFGHDVAAADLDGWRELTTRLPETGVTAFVPTIITAPIERLVGVLERYRRDRPELDAAGGARTLGMHVEGPFLAPGRHGAHPLDQLVAASDVRVDALLTAADGALAYHTLAPERPGGLDAVARLVAAGVRVAVGHSDATDAQVRAAADAGATLVTHLYNAQRPLHHRDPGVVGAALSDPRLTVGLIADLHHVAPTALRVAFTAAAGRVALVTDAIAAAGMAPGDYELAGQRLTVRADAPPVLEDGTLAGSVLRLDEAVGNVIGCGIDPAVALTAATRVPADALGEHERGRLASGARADLVWLDEDWRAVATWVGGRLVHVDGERAPWATAT